MIARMLYLITNRKLVRNKDFYHIINEAIKGGISAIILREKDLDYEELLPMALKIKEAIGNSGVKLIINKDLKVAHAVNANGFHTSFKNFIVAKPEFQGTLGVSIHSLQEAVEAEKLGADYLLFGHIFETNCKKAIPPRGVDLIKAIKSQVSIPLIALGGITPENIHQVIEAGADGAAVMSTIMMSDNSFALIKEYTENMYCQKTRSCI